MWISKAVVFLLVVIPLKKKNKKNKKNMIVTPSLDIETVTVSW